MSWNEQIRQQHIFRLHANSSPQISFAQKACIRHASNSEQLKQFHQLKHGMIGQECLTIPCNVARCFNYNLLSVVNVVKLLFFQQVFPWMLLTWLAL